MKGDITVCRKSCNIKAGEACPQMPPCEIKIVPPPSSRSGYGPVVESTMIHRAGKPCPQIFIQKKLSNNDIEICWEGLHMWTRLPVPSTGRSWPCSSWKVFTFQPMCGRHLHTIIYIARYVLTRLSTYTADVQFWLSFSFLFSFPFSSISE